MKNPFTEPKARSFVGMLRGQLLFSVLLGCGTSPCAAPPPVSIRPDPTPPPVASTPTAAMSAVGPTPQPHETTSGMSHPEDSAAPSRARIDWGRADYLVDFPTSMTEGGDRIAAIISSESDGEACYPQWIRIKNRITDKVDQEIVMIDWDLSAELESAFFRGKFATVAPELQPFVDAANAVLATDRWRPFPCISIVGQRRPDRIGPGCELLSELSFEFEDPWLVISRGERRIARLEKPTWSPTYGNPKCKGRVFSGVDSVAFDPDTGLFVILLYFWGAGHVGTECGAPREDFHPLLLPQFRRKPAQQGDGGAPLPERDANAGLR